MIIFDYRHTAIRNFMALTAQAGSVELEEGLVRHMILNSLRAVNLRHRKTYGELVLACEGGELWRKDVFPYYKAARKKGKEKSLVDWRKLDLFIEQVSQEIQVYLKYRVVKVPGAEGDDVIASIVKSVGNESFLESPGIEKAMIVSSDGDFKQLLKYSNVRLWDPIKQRDQVSNNPARDLKEKIIRGDSGDGVPNVLSDDDTFVTDKRSKPIYEKKLWAWLEQEPKEFCDQAKWERNEKLIDFNRIPSEIEAAVMHKYDQEAGKNPGSVLDYFQAFRLRNLMEYVQDFA